MSDGQASAEAPIAANGAPVALPQAWCPCENMVLLLAGNSCRSDRKHPIRNRGAQARAP